MTGYCAQQACGRWRDLNPATCWCADCEVTWAEQYQAATKGDLP